MIERLERLFGRTWQAALDHAGVLSRRRAREIGAGDSGSEGLLATLELLDAAPPRHWPARWAGLGKFAERCPTLPQFDGLLVDGKIRREHAVVLWDMESGRESNFNVCVGMLPPEFRDLPRDHPIRAQWGTWNRQWGNAHGGATVAGWMSRDIETPEGVLASWIARGRLSAEERERAEAVLERHVWGFSRALMTRLATEFKKSWDKGEPFGG